MNKQLTAQEEEELEKMMSIGRELGFEEAQWRYDQIPVPDSLDALVRTTIQEQNAQNERREKRAARRRSVRIAARTIGSMAAAMLLLMIPLNTSEAFARQMQQIPVLGKLAEVLTLRSYSYEENDANVNVQMPDMVAVTPLPENEAVSFSLENDVAEAECCDEDTDAVCYDGDSEDSCYDAVEGAGATVFSAEVNARIQEIVETYDVAVNYVVTYNAEDTLSLVFTTLENGVAADEENYYYNLDMNSGEYLTLRDMLGEDWIAICNESIDSQIENRLAADTEKMLCYWGYGEAVEDMYEAKFTTVDEETVFYINAQGNPVVCFGKYEIAPGYMGIQEFEIFP